MVQHFETIFRLFSKNQLSQVKKFDPENLSGKNARIMNVLILNVRKQNTEPEI